MRMAIRPSRGQLIPPAREKVRIFWVLTKTGMRYPTFSKTSPLELDLHILRTEDRILRTRAGKEIMVLTLMMLLSSSDLFRMSPEIGTSARHGEGLAIRAVLKVWTILERVTMPSFKMETWSPQSVLILPPIFFWMLMDRLDLPPNPCSMYQAQFLSKTARGFRMPWIS